MDTWEIEPFTDFSDRELQGVFSHPPVLEGRLAGHDVSKLKIDALVDDSERYDYFSREAQWPYAEADVERELQKRRAQRRTEQSKTFKGRLLNILGL